MPPWLPSPQLQDTIYAHWHSYVNAWKLVSTPNFSASLVDMEVLHKHPGIETVLPAFILQNEPLAEEIGDITPSPWWSLAWTFGKFEH